MGKKSTTIALATFAAFAGIGLSGAFAQGNETRLAGSQVVDKSAYTNLPNFIKLGQEISQENFVNWATYAFNIPSNSTFIPYKVEKDQLGFTHTRYRQYVNGLEVEGTQVISHCKDGKITMANGDYYQNFSSKLTPAITEGAALQHALNKVNAKKYMWEDESMVKLMEENFKPVGKLVVVHKRGADYSAANMRLAYKFNIYAQKPLYRANVFVDANTGEILDEQNLICTVTVVGTADTKYSGTVSMSCDNNAGTYRLRETGRGNGINTYNMNNTTTYSSTDFTNTSSSWTSTGNDQAATDAHWGAEMTYDYYKQIHNRNSIDNAGYALNSYVHYSTNYVNAFWDGTRMTYGDGDLTQDFDIMTALDVCGHEITHGLTSNTSALNGGGTGEPDALNEGNSDIFGTTIEVFARPTQNDWIMGADIMPDHKGIRDMSQPKNLGQPNCYNGVNWDPNGEPHNNNGPFIYWYYLLCQGGNGTNDLGNVWNVSGITMDEAKFIAFRQSTVYFTSSTTYANARNYSIQAATDLYGACSKEVASTTNAWYAVGVGAASTVAWPSASFKGGATLTSCTAPLAVTFTNSSTGATSYNWSFGDGGTSTTASPVHTYTAGGIYAVQLIATGTCSASAKDTMKKVSYVTVNGPPTAASPSASCGAHSATLSATGVGSITWSNATGTVATGATYSTPTLTTTTSYSVTSSIMTAGTATLSGAPTTTATIGAGSFLAISNTHYLVFDVTAGFTLKTVDIYVQTAGTTCTVQVLDNAGVVVGSAAPTLTAGKNTVTLNCHIPVGTGYHLTASGTATLYRNSAGASYPIAVGTVASITGNDVMSTAPAYYYWFYNWIYAKDVPCYSNPTVVTVSVTPGPTVTATSATVCAGTGASLTASGATTYTWMPGGLTGATVTVTPSSTTTYTVTGTTAGCNGLSNGVVTVKASPTVTVNSPTICNGTSANLSASGATSYTWNPGGTTGATLTVTPSSTTSYTVTGTNAVGCNKAVISVVTVNPMPTVTATSGTVCAGTSANLTASGATTYTWMPGGLTGATVTVTPSSTTNYTVTGSNGTCSGSANGIVTVNASPTVTATSTSICSGTSANLSAGGATTYTWNPGGLTGATVTVTPSSTTTYTVTGASAGCNGSANSIVTVNATPTVTANSISICPGSSGTLSASGATTYTWNPGGLTGATVTVTPSSTTTYTVTGASAGCNGSANSVVTVSSTLSVTSTSASMCAGTSANLSASGATTYTWNPGGLTGATVTVTPSSTTTYTVTGTTAGCSGSGNGVVTVNPMPTVTATSGTVCAGSSANLSASGATTYTWMPGGLTGATVIVTPSSTTSYTVTGDSAGCTSSANAVVTTNALPTIGVNAAQDSICAGGSTGITVTGSSTSYSWSPGSSLSSTTGSNVTASPGSTTTYTVIGTDPNGCQNTAQQTVIVNVCTGISSAHSVKGVEVYPNPAHDNLMISSGAIIKNISIVDMIGKTVLSQQLSNETSVSVDVSSFPAGVYFVKVNTADTQKLIRVIKQ